MGGSRWAGRRGAFLREMSTLDRVGKPRGKGRGRGKGGVCGTFKGLGRGARQLPR